MAGVQEFPDSFKLFYARLRHKKFIRGIFRIGRAFLNKMSPQFDQINKPLIKTPTVVKFN